VGLASGIACTEELEGADVTVTVASGDEVVDSTGVEVAG